MMSSILPSFSNLLAFDAAARHGSFTRASRELNVSQPAISRRVAALEADLGVHLFSRKTKPLRLTATGETLFAVLRSGLGQLEAVVTDIRALQRDRKMTIAAAPGFLSYWLVPRLSELVTSFPECELRLVTGDQPGKITEADIDVRFGDGDWPGVEAVKIVGEEVFAVCSPNFLKGRSAPRGIDHIKAERLLQLSGGRERRYDWQSWFEAVGSTVPKKLNTIDFDSYSLLVSAALAGQGIALCWSGLLDEYLQTGALVKISDESFISTRGYFATFALGTGYESVTARMARWLGAHHIPGRSGDTQPSA